MKRYRIITGDSAKELEIKVNAALSDGTWGLLCAPFVSDVSGRQFNQAMVKLPRDLWNTPPDFQLVKDA